jgi:hypothetical protein
MYSGYRFFSGGKERPSCDAESSPASSAVVEERVELYLYSSYGTCDLYKTSVPVEGRTLPLPLPFNRKLVIPIANYPDRIGHSGKHFLL